MSVINTNVKALDAQAAMMKVDRSSKASMERLSTGLRINSAKDDAAGLAITNRMTSQIRGYAVAIRNSNDGISMAQTAEGALGQINDMLQRMRELAVQAGNGAMSDADRGSLQLEIAQMKAQINDVALKTNHNNIKLLDGSAGKVVLQTGTNANDTMTIGFDSAQTKDIGFGPRASLSSVGATYDSGIVRTSATGVGKTGALYNGDLLLNGVVVGDSLTTDDQLSFAGNAASAIAKAAAINRVAEQSGVYATVGQTTAFGHSMVASNGAAGTIKINGVDTAAVTLGEDLEINRQMLAQAINNVSSQTGVTALNTHDDNQGLVLVAKDGRNVTVSYTQTTATFNQTTTGLAADGTYVGSFDLSTKDGSSFTVSSQTDGQIQNAGLRVGTYQSNVAQFASLQRAATVSGTVPGDGTSTTGELLGNTLIINGVGVDAAVGSDDDASNTDAASSVKSASAIAIAAAINKKTNLTGVRAVAEPNVLRGTGFNNGEVTTINLNGIAISTSLDAHSTLDDVINAINAYQGQTGVVASAWGEGLQLVAADGRNISIAVDGAGGADAIGLTGVTVGSGATEGDADTYYASVRLESDKQFSVASGNEGNDENFSKLGFRRGTFGGANNGVKVAEVDVTTQSGATVALQAIDAAIESVSAMQAKAGAYQNRLDAVVNNLTESNQNMSASRSRIQDTDYATETTNLARSQIISQAATAMLAQANQSAQSVLALLK